VTLEAPSREHPPRCAAQQGTPAQGLSTALAARLHGHVAVAVNSWEGRSCDPDRDHTRDGLPANARPAGAQEEGMVRSRIAAKHPNSVISWYF
jgi:hypothetical protein